MSNSFAILPCNGLDKCAGCVAREMALKLGEAYESEIICPVLYRVSDTSYNKIALEKPLLVIDGCGTRCASKLASEKNLKIAMKINITDEAKKHNISITNGLRLKENEYQLIDLLIKEITEIKEKGNVSNTSLFPEKFDYQTYMKDKFIFKLPKGDFYFNENDCWAYVSGGKARIGITDYIQKSLSDIMFFDSPNLGSEIQQFDEAGSVESGKAVFEVVSPVSGRITAINEKLLDSPELINENPYEDGWIAEIELSDFDSDKELLYGFDQYFEIMKRKVDEYHV